MTCLIVGADSGIGSALLARIPDSVGTSRKDASDHIFLDVVEEGYWPSFDTKFEDVYFCIAVDGLSNSPAETIDINATQSIKFLEYLTQFISDGGTIRVLTSVMGSLSKGFMMPVNDANMFYRMSKAALNMGVMDLAKRHEHINWQLVHPGFVKTKLTRHLSYIEQATEPDYAAEKIINLPKIEGISYIEIDATGTRMIV